jgi:hypothetical protein
MIEMYATVAVALIAAGIALGIVFITSRAVRDEQNAGPWLADSGPSRRAAGVRTVTGLDVRRRNAFL